MSVLGVVAAGVTGFFTGWNPQAMALAYSIGSGVDTVVNAPDRVGPRLDDLKVQMSQYGATIPFEWGCNRHTGTIIWPRSLDAVEHKHEESAKGGPQNVTFTYTLSCAVLVCEGPIKGIRRIWANKKIIYDFSADNTGLTQDAAIGSIRIHLGSDNQGLDPLIEATDGAGPAYRGYAYVVFQDYDVTDLGGRPPQWEFEVITGDTAEIPAPTTYGEAYGITPGAGQYDRTFGYDVDQTTGHLWITTMSGHATLNPDTGEFGIDLGVLPHPQVQEYDPVTKTMESYIDLPAFFVDGQPEYGIGGAMVVSGGYIFTGLGAPGAAAGGSGFPHGLAINTELKNVIPLTDECSHEQYQNAFYWPSVPVPAIDNNKVYLAGGNGLSGGFALAFFPASVAADPFGINGPPTTEDYDPIPDFSVEPSRWVEPIGWGQVRSKLTPCPLSRVFDGVHITFPGWAFKSTVLTQPNAVVVQGYGSSGHSYLALVNSDRVTGFDKTAATVKYCELPGSQVVMPSIVWDTKNQKLWAFPEVQTYTSLLYEIVQGPAELTAVGTGYLFPKTAGLLRSGSVAGATVDQATGYLRLLMFDGEMILFDPISQTVLESQQTGVAVSQNGKMWDYPGAAKVLFADGFRIHDIPYGVPLGATQVALSTIVSDICLRAGLEADDIDVTDLTDLVDGYIVPRQMTARAAIEPLQAAFFFDAVESDDKIKFVKRGGALAATIPEDDRAAHEHGQAIPDALSITRAFELELPAQCDVEYPDIDADHLIGNQYDRRITKDTRQQINMQMPVVMTAAKAKQIARTTLYSAWLNQSLRWTTTRKYAHLEPTSVVELPTAAASYRGRITAKREQPNGVIEWEARVDSVDVYAQTGDGATATQYSPQEIFVAGVTQLALMDIPLLRDEDDNAGYYAAMGAL